jgi:hypothetical protein
MGVTCQEHPQVLYQEKVTLSFAVAEPDTSLTISFSQSEVWPTIPNSGAQHRILQQVDNVVDEITVELTDGCAPIAGHEVAITADWVYTSGGHIHETSSESSPDANLMGTFTLIDSARSEAGSITTRTGSDGRIRLQYEAPQFGGRVNIRAETVLLGSPIVNANQLTIRVPDLILLPFNASYVKLGGTENHPGPDEDAPFNLSFRPDTNHWALSETIGKLLAINAIWVSRDSAGQYPLWINDLSLPSGGLFDVAGTWSRYPDGHNQHRVGRDTDIRTKRSKTDTTTAVVVRTETLNGGEVRVRNRGFEQLVKAVGGCPRPEVHGSGSGEHYHLYFYPKQSYDRWCR